MAFHFTPTPSIVCKFIHELVPSLTPPPCYPALISTTLRVYSAPATLASSLILTHITCMFGSGPIHCPSSYWNVLLQLSTWLFLSLPQLPAQMPLYSTALLWPPHRNPLYSAWLFPITLSSPGLLCMYTCLWGCFFPGEGMLRETWGLCLFSFLFRFLE